MRLPSGEKLATIGGTGHRHETVRPGSIGVCKVQIGSLDEHELPPIGDQFASRPVRSPRRRGEPAGKGTSQKGVSLLPVDSAVLTRSWEWSGEISSIHMLLIGDGMDDVSPPVVETCSNTRPSGRHWVT